VAKKFRIQIHNTGVGDPELGPDRISLGLPDPEPSERGTDTDAAPDPAPDPSIIKQKKDVNVASKSNKQQNLAELRKIFKNI